MAKQTVDSIDECRKLSSADSELVLKRLKEKPTGPDKNLQMAYKKISNLFKLEENANTIYHVDSTLFKK